MPMTFKIIFFIFLFVSLNNTFANDKSPYLVYLKPGSILTKISDKTELTLVNGIYAKVLETNFSRRNIFIVYDKKGMAKYEASAGDILEIEEDVRILPKINAEISYPPQSTFKSNDKKANFDSQFNLHVDNLLTSGLNSVYDQNIVSIVGTRFEVRTLYNSELPINFGWGSSQVLENLTY
jgi:hypothetical protein